MKAIGPNIVPDNGGYYIHIPTGRKYMVIGVGKMKHPEQGHWIPSVTYRPYVENDIETRGIVYTRELHSFQIHFADAEGIVEV